MISLNWQPEKKKLFWADKKFTPQTQKDSWKMFVKQIGKNI